MEYTDVHIETTLPKPWEEEHSFNDVLYDWMQRAPWLAISAAAHLLVFFILMAIPWDKLSRREDRVIEAQLQQTPEEEFEEPEEEIIEEEIEEEPIEEPVLQDAEVTETEDVEDFQEAEGDPDFLSDAMNDDNFNDVIGIGGGAGGKFGRRRGGRRNLQSRGGRGVAQALVDGLEWLKHHQSGDGSWDTDGFMTNCGDIGSTICDMEGEPTWDVGLTGLVLLAFLGDGNTTSEGEYKDVVSRGINWLRKQQDPDTGLFGNQNAAEFIYNHAIATLAICEAYYFSKSPLIRRSAQSAVDYIQAARNPYSGWRYEVPPIGDNDTSVTGWMIFALSSAKDAGLDVQQSALDGGLAWIDEVTDQANGLVGYDNFGSLSSRTTANAHFPREKGEAMTAVALLCRFFLGQDPREDEIMVRHADRLRRLPPKWEPENFGCDMYYWYYGSYAMYQMGEPYWKDWNNAMTTAVVDSQRKDGDEKGSWDPVGPWGYAGGRVYSTALMVLCLEVHYRYARVLGAR